MYMITPATGCTFSTCAIKDKCVRYANYLSQLQESDTLSILNPHKVEQTDEGCPHYLVKTVQRFAYGFKALSGSIPSANAGWLMYKSHLGGKSTYYRYYRGERSLSPTEQQRFLSVVKELGGNPDIGFDRYQDQTVYVKP